MADPLRRLLLMRVGPSAYARAPTFHLRKPFSVSGQGRMEIDLGRTVTTSIVRLEEGITRGQAVAQYSVHGFDGQSWRRLSAGTIGYAKLDRFPPVAISRVRVHVEEAVAPAHAIGMRVQMWHLAVSCSRRMGRGQAAAVGVTSFRSSASRTCG